ncbi:MAG: tetratricopeptide repeat protein [Sedimentisphaerales bacterium]|nr:tetratricopeptide repeat protein [Sedimentisphaerales bacterium]
MSTQVQEITAMIFDTGEPLTDEQFETLLRTVRSGQRERLEFAETFDPEAKKRASGYSRNPVMATKAAQGFYALGDYTEAIKWFEWAGPGSMQCYLKACCLRELGDYEAAIREFELAEEKGYEGFNIAMEVVECLRRQGHIEEAQARLKKASRIGEIRAEYHYQLGCLRDAEGLREEALAEYKQAVCLDPSHTRALFALAYGCDLYGDEDVAIETYKRCLASGPVHVSALLNLAVLYEDREDYELARECVKRVLAAYPNHGRARLFLKDIESSMTMYYDEDQERRVDKRNQVLQIPISDFELSVRSRNCLKKMNIKCVGDLLRVTEQELLAYKNFGETSLQEIKSILVQKGLRLGQMLEERKDSRSKSTQEEEQALQEANDLLAQPVSELELSVRARKALQRLNINTIGDLTQCTEAELLGCKNFGMTSLMEVKQRLKERGIALRTLDE